MNSKQKFLSEKSAGGLVLRQKEGADELLMVEVKNLVGDIVWTFPKGHLEPGESQEEAALREVEEETGWRCEILPAGKEKVFERVLYWFRRGENLVKKEVAWFLMVPVKKTGGKDADEIRKVKWLGTAEAGKKVKYPSDKKLLNKLAACAKNLR